MLIQEEQVSPSLWSGIEYEKGLYGGSALVTSECNCFPRCDRNREHR